MKDWRGADVFPGDLVIYASRSGSSLNIVEGQVVAVIGDMATVEFIRDRYWERKRKTFHVSGKYLTVVNELPEAPNDSA